MQENLEIQYTFMATKSEVNEPFVIFRSSPSLRICAMDLRKTAFSLAILET
jgi:hypothetical protein